MVTIRYSTGPSIVRLLFVSMHSFGTRSRLMMTSTLMIMIIISLSSPSRVHAATLTFNWIITSTTHALQNVGQPRTLLLINDQSPGPLVRASEGDTIIVTVTNKIDANTTIHWHGMYQRNTPWADGVPGISQCSIMSGKTYTYQFIANPAGTHFYHSHSGTQLIDGLIGPLIINPSPATLSSLSSPLPSYGRDEFLFFYDWHNSDSNNGLQDWVTNLNEPIPDAIGVYSPLSTIDVVPSAVNASSKISATQNAGFNSVIFDSVAAAEKKPYITYQVKTSDVCRIRLLNAGAMATYAFSIDYLTFKVVEVDGVLVEPYSTNTIRIASAQRYSVIVNFADLAATAAASQNAVFWRLSYIDDLTLGRSQVYPNAGLNTFKDFYGSFGFDGTTTIPTYDPTSYVAPAIPTIDDFNLLQLKPLIPRAVPAATHSFSLQPQVNANGVVNGAAWSVNGYSNMDIETGDSLLFRQMYRRQRLDEALQTPPSSGVITGNTRNEFLIPYNAVVEVLLNDAQTLDHPWHLHGQHFWVISLTDSAGNTITPTNGIYRDTLFLPPNGQATIRFRADNVGVWVFHCHFDWHIASGFMSTTIVAPPNDGSYTYPSPPQDNLDMCAASSSIPYTALAPVTQFVTQGIRQPTPLLESGDSYRSPWHLQGTQTNREMTGTVAPAPGTSYGYVSSNFTCTTSNDSDDGFAVFNVGNTFSSASNGWVTSFTTLLFTSAITCQITPFVAGVKSSASSGGTITVTVSAVGPTTTTLGADNSGVVTQLNNPLPISAGQTVGLAFIDCSPCKSDANTNTRAEYFMSVASARGTGVAMSSVLKPGVDIPVSSSSSTWKQQPSQFQISYTVAPVSFKPTTVPYQANTGHGQPFSSSSASTILILSLTLYVASVVNCCMRD